MNRFGVSVVAGVLLVLVPFLAFGQSTTTGSLRGTVVDETGQPVPGVMVTISSDGLIGGKVDTYSNAKGFIRFPSLPPGTYRIEASMTGFAPTILEGQRVSLGSVATVTLTMKLLQGIEEVITVTADAQIISTSSTATTHNLDEEALERIPLTRDANSFMNITPGVSGGLAYGGTQSNANAYNLDGVDVSNPGSGQHWILPSPDWIQEIQVAGLGADAEYGGFTGAMVNIITKSGGNEFSGDVRLYYSGGGMIEDNDTDQAFGEVSFNVGGPVIKDRLWFFISGQETQDDYTPVDASDNEEQQLSRYLGKLTFMANSQNTLTALIDYDGKFVEHRGISNDVTKEASLKQESPNISYNLTWESIFSEKMFFTAKLTGFNGEDNRLPYNGENTPGRETSDRMWTENSRYTERFDNSRTTWDVSLSYFKDGLFTESDYHSFKFGIVYGLASYNEERTRNGGLTFRDRFDGFDSGNEIFLHTKHQELNAYIQDSINIGNVTINPGFRYTDYRAGFRDGVNDLYNVDFVAPRLGIVWDIMGDGSSTVKVHWGRYYEGLYAYLFDREQSGNAFTEEVYWEFEDPDNPDVSQAFIVGGSSPDQAILDENIKHPYVDQFLFAYEHEITRDMMVGVDVIYREFKDIIAMINTNEDYDNLIAADNPITGEDTPFYDLLSDPEYLLTNPEGAYRDYTSVVVRLDKRYSNGWSFRGSLGWANLEGNTYKQTSYADEWKDKNGQTNADGKLPGFKEYEAKLDVSYDLPWDMYVTAYYTYYAGEYWTPYALFNGLYYNDRAEVYMTERGSEQYDDRHLIDLKVNKRFKLSEKFDFDITVDVFNLLNSDTITEVDESWGDYEYDYQDHPAGSAWVPWEGYMTTQRIERPREIRLGLKFSF